MEKKNNKKYLSIALALISTSLGLNYNTFDLVYIYKKFDFTGICQTMQRVLTITILIISIICLVKSIRAREKGVDYLFNKCMVAVFIIYTISSIFTYIYLRTYEEKTALKMKSDIEIYSQETKQKQLKKNKVKNKNSFEYDFYNTISEGLAESEYRVNDKYYERKKEIIEQIENSSYIERYSSMLFYNYSYEYYGSVGYDEREYYETFLYCFLVGIFGTIFYLFNTKEKNNIEKANVFYEKNSTFF